MSIWRQILIPGLLTQTIFTILIHDIAAIDVNPITREDSLIYIY